MTEPPDYVIRSVFVGGSVVHQDIPPINGLPALTLPAQTQVDQLAAFTQNLAGKDALAAGTIPVSGSGVSGTVAASSLAIAPASAVTVKATNMLVSQNFTSPNTIAAEMHWSWDGTDGNLTLGCAKVICDGTQPDLVSNEIAVVTSETIEVACQVKWENIVYTSVGPQIILGVEKYRAGRDQATGGVTYLDLGGYDVASVTSPAASSDWEVVSLAGTYVVEPGVDLLRFRFRAATTITAGTVKWDEAEFLKLDLIADNAVPGVGITVDDIVTKLYGSDGAGFTHNDSAVALANTSASLLSVNSRLAALEAQGSTGVIAGDDFLWSGEIITSPNWGGVYFIDPALYGFYRANGSDAVWSAAPVLSIDFTQTGLFDWQGAGQTSTTDYQLIQLLLSTAPSTSHGFLSYTYLLGRVSSGLGSYVRASVCSDGTYFVDYWNGSSLTVMNSGTCAVPGMGGLLSLYCGDKSNNLPRHFKFMSNNSTICEFNEVGTGSPLGTSNHKWGFGGRAQGGINLADVTSFPTQASPPAINQWLAYEQ